MKMQHVMKQSAKWSAVALGMTAAAYASYAGMAWLRYGHPSRGTAEEDDALIDRFMPVYEVSERRSIRVAAPAHTTFEAACDADLMRSPLICALFRARELVLGSERDTSERPRGVLAFAKSIGWRVLAEEPGREIVMGSATQPWNANVVFRGLPPDEFLAFDEPGYVKILWTLRADANGPDRSIFRHETRVMTTDPVARAKFRQYWAFFSPGIKLIRWVMLEPLRRDAERRSAAQALLQTGESSTPRTAGRFIGRRQARRGSVPPESTVRQQSSSS